MGYVTILIIAAIFAAHKLGLTNLFFTALNSRESKFTRKISDDQSAVFSVIPARASWTNFIIAGVIVTGATLLLPEAFPLWLVLGILVLWTSFKDVKYRKAVRLIVSPEGVRAGDRFFQLQNIADLSLKKSLKVKEEPVATTMYGQPTSAMIGRGMGQRQSERSYMLCLRCLDGSRQHVLSGGLTQPCADALLKDISSHISTLQSKQAA